MEGREGKRRDDRYVLLDREGSNWLPVTPEVPNTWATRRVGGHPALLSGLWVGAGGVSRLRLAGISSLLSHAVPSTPRIHPSGRKVPKLMFSRKVRVVVQPSGTPSRAVEGPGPRPLPQSQSGSSSAPQHLHPWLCPPRGTGCRSQLSPGLSQHPWTAMQGE